MSIEAMKQEPKATSQFVETELTVGQRYTNSGQQLLEEIESLYAAIQQAEAKTDEPVAKNGHMVMVDSGALQMVRNALRRDAGNGKRIRAEMLAALDAATHPAPGVPEFSRIAKRKLDELQEQGFAITGYAIQRGPVRGFIDGFGFVGWWQGEPDPGVPDDGWVSVDERIPRIDGETNYIGVNSAGFMCVFNALMGTKCPNSGRVFWHCDMETAEESIRMMSGLTYWRKAPSLAASPTQKGGE